MSVLTVAQVKARLNKTTAEDDAELQEMLDAAEAAYAERVGPIGTKTLRYDGGRSSIILPLNANVTEVEYEDGTPVSLDDLDYNESAGILYWPGGSFAAGSRNVLVTFTASLPAHHKEAILSDVAGLFAATQRGNTPGALPGGYEAGFEERTTPLVLFPRIRALASPGIG